MDYLKNDLNKINFNDDEIINNIKAISNNINDNNDLYKYKEKN